MSSLLDKRYKVISKLAQYDADKENAISQNRINFEKQHPFIAEHPFINDVGKSLVNTAKFIDDSSSKIASLADPYFQQTDQNSSIYNYAENVGKAQQILPGQYDTLTGLAAMLPQAYGLGKLGLLEGSGNIGAGIMSKILPKAESIAGKLAVKAGVGTARAIGETIPFSLTSQEAMTGSNDYSKNMITNFNPESFAKNTAMMAGMTIPITAGIGAIRSIKPIADAGALKYKEYKLKTQSEGWVKLHNNFMTTLKDDLMQKYKNNNAVNKIIQPFQDLVKKFSVEKDGEQYINLNKLMEDKTIDGNSKKFFTDLFQHQMDTTDGTTRQVLNPVNKELVPDLTKRYYMENEEWFKQGNNQEEPSYTQHINDNADLIDKMLGLHNDINKLGITEYLSNEDKEKYIDFHNAIKNEVGNEVDGVDIKSRTKFYNELKNNKEFRDYIENTILPRIKDNLEPQTSPLGSPQKLRPTDEKFIKDIQNIYQKLNEAQTEVFKNIKDDSKTEIENGDFNSYYNAIIRKMKNVFTKNKGKKDANTRIRNLIQNTKIADQVLTKLEALKNEINSLNNVNGEEKINFFQETIDNYFKKEPETAINDIRNRFERLKEENRAQKIIHNNKAEKIKKQLYSDLRTRAIQEHFIEKFTNKYTKLKVEGGKIKYEKTFEEQRNTNTMNGDENPRAGSQFNTTSETSGEIDKPTREASQQLKVVKELTDKYNKKIPKGKTTKTKKGNKYTNYSEDDAKQAIQNIMDYMNETGKKLSDFIESNDIKDKFNITEDGVVLNEGLKQKDFNHIVNKAKQYIREDISKQRAELIKNFQQQFQKNSLGYKVGDTFFRIKPILDEWKKPLSNNDKENLNIAYKDLENQLEELNALEDQAKSMDNTTGTNFERTGETVGHKETPEVISIGQISALKNQIKDIKNLINRKFKKSSNTSSLATTEKMKKSIDELEKDIDELEKQKSLNNEIEQLKKEKDNVNTTSKRKQEITRILNSDKYRNAKSFSDKQQELLDDKKERLSQLKDKFGKITNVSEVSKEEYIFDSTREPKPIPNKSEEVNLRTSFKEKATTFVLKIKKILFTQKKGGSYDINNKELEVQVPDGTVNGNLKSFKIFLHEIRHAIFHQNDIDITKLRNKISELAQNGLINEFVVKKLDKISNKYEIKLDDKTTKLSKEAYDILKEEYVNHFLDILTMSDIFHRNSDKLIATMLGVSKDDVKINMEDNLLTEPELNKIVKSLMDDPDFDNIMRLQTAVINDSENGLRRLFREPTAPTKYATEEVNKIDELLEQMPYSEKFKKISEEMDKLTQSVTLGAMLFPKKDMIKMMSAFASFNAYNNEVTKEISALHKEINKMIEKDYGNDIDIGYTLSKAQYLGLHKLVDEFGSWKELSEAIKNKTAYSQDELQSELFAVYKMIMQDIDIANMKVPDAIKENINRKIQNLFLKYSGKSKGKSFITGGSIFDNISKVANEEGSKPGSIKKGNYSKKSTQYHELYKTNMRNSQDVYVNFINNIERIINKELGKDNKTDLSIYKKNLNNRITKIIDKQIAIQRVSILIKNRLEGINRIKELFDSNKYRTRYAKLSEKIEQELKSNGIFENQFGVNIKNNFVRDEMAIKVAISKVPKGGIVLGKTQVGTIYTIKKNYTILGNQSGLLDAGSINKNSKGITTYKVKAQIINEKGKIYAKVGKRKFEITKLKNVKSIDNNGNIEFYIPNKQKFSNNDLFETDFATQYTRNKFLINSARNIEMMRNSALVNLQKQGIVLRRFSWLQKPSAEQKLYEKVQFDNKAYFVKKQYMNQFKGTAGVTIKGKILVNIARVIAGAIDIAKGTLLTHSIKAYINNAIASSGTYFIHAKQATVKDILNANKEFDNITNIINFRNKQLAKLEVLRTTVGDKQAIKNLEESIKKIDDKLERNHIAWALQNGLQSSLRQEYAQLSLMPENQLISLLKTNNMIKISNKAIENLKNALLRPETKWGDLAGSYFDKTEVVPKLALFDNLIKKQNFTREEAKEYVQQAFPDYTLNLPENVAIAGVIIPYLKYFISTPKMINFAMKKHPGKFMALTMGTMLFQYGSYNIGNPSSNDTWAKAHHFIKLPGDNNYLNIGSMSNYNFSLPNTLSPATIAKGIVYPFNINPITHLGR